jgi:hypothetical protein
LHRALHARDVALEILERAVDLERLERAAERRPEVVPFRVVAEVGRLVAVEVLGRDRGTLEDVLVPVIAAVEDATDDGVEEGLRALRLLVLVEERDERPLQRLPLLLVTRLRELLLQDLDGLEHARVVHVDAGAARLVHHRPVAALPALLRSGARLAKEAVMPVESVDDRLRDLRRAVREAEHRRPF